MNHMLAVRRFAAGDAPAAAAIIRSLPDYFTDDAPAKAERYAASHEAWAITDSGTVTGFAIAARKSPGGAEILWIAVDAARRGCAHGTRLPGHVMDHLATAGISVVEAKTLDRSSGYRPYEATRAFWERNGLIQLDTIDPQPGNPATRQPGNPATRQQYTSPQSAQPDDKHVSQLQLTGTYPVTRVIHLATWKGRSWSPPIFLAGAESLGSGRRVKGQCHLA
jgi:GNAT superfamily N-acetyltransferase